MISETNDSRQRVHWDEDSRYRPCDHPVPVAFADQRIQYIRSWFDLSQVSSALDVGCGNGLSMHRMLRHVGRIFGVDRSAHMLHRHPHRSRTALADGRALPFRSKAFDLVYGWEVLHHVDHPEQVVSEAVRVSRRWVLFAEPNRRNPFQFAYALYDREHRWVLRYSLNYMRGLMTGAGAALRHASRGGWIFPNVTPPGLAPLLKMLPFRSPIGISNWVLGEVEHDQDPLLADCLMKRITPTDAILALVFAALSLLALSGRWQNGQLDLYLSSDAANIASFAAALDHPDHFRGDGVLEDSGSFDFYLAVHIPVVRWLEDRAGDYGVAFVWLLAPHVFLQLVGFYVLGRVLFRSRPWAFGYALLIAAPLTLPLGTFWGIYADAIPRVSFQALLPFILAAAFHWRNRPPRWPLVLALMGLLMYVHPVSAPVWGAVLWLGFLVIQPPRWDRRRRVGHALLTGGAFLLVTLPWIIHYLSTFAFGGEAPYDQVRAALEFRLMPGVLRPHLALVDFFMSNPEVFVIGLGACAFTWFLDAESRKQQRMVHVWMAGILVLAGLFPAVEHAIARAYRLHHLEIDLIRNLRYLVPLFLTFWVWTFAAWNRREAGFQRPSAVGLVIIAAWIGQHPPSLVQAGLQNVVSGRLAQENPLHASFRDAVSALGDTTTPGQPVLATFAPVHIRYGALRPVAYTFKDGGILSYADHTRLVEWHRTALETRRVHESMRALYQSGDWEGVWAGYEGLAREVGARVLLLRVPPDADLATWPVLFRNDLFVVARVGEAS